jgi:uncharacterized integral membrane protein
VSQQLDQGQDKRRIGGGAIAALVGLGVLLVFVLQNRESVQFSFLTITFTWPMWLYTIVVAAFGALVWFGFGVVRRRRRRKARRDD